MGSVLEIVLSKVNKHRGQYSIVLHHGEVYSNNIIFLCVFVKGTKKLMVENLKNIAKCRTQREFLSCDLYGHLSSSWSLNVVFMS